jgi:D-glycero-D-manno-heptose 1,7-bisphosphate phosphatase
VFLDRDGVINELVFHKEVNKPSSPWNIEEFKFMPGLEKPLEKLSKMGYFLFVISNQPDMSRGFIKKSTTERINQIIYEKLPIDDIVVCPHDDHHNCRCRKPKPGMILDLCKKWDVDPNKSLLIGDNWKDITAGKKAGCKTIILDKPYNKSVDADHRLGTLESAVKLIKSANIES